MDLPATQKMAREGQDYFLFWMMIALISFRIFFMDGMDDRATMSGVCLW
jgi:hypothetical protein